MRREDVESALAVLALLLLFALPFLLLLIVARLMVGPL